MPTIILLDVSLSVARSLIGEDKTYKEVMQRGVLHLLQELEEHHPLEHTSLLTFSSTARVLVPFTRDFTSLKNALFNIRLEDRTQVISGLRAAVDYAVASQAPFGVFSQLILVTNGCPPTEADAILGFEVPPTIKLHVVGFGTRAQTSVDVLSALAWKTKGTFEFVELPQGAPLMKQAFANIIESHYIAYQGVLACGHLHSRITLYPNPNLTMVTDNTSSVLPSAISIIGFIPNKRIQSPSSISRHYVLPSSADTQPLCLIVHDVLRNERLSGVVKFGGSQQQEWFGLLNSVCEKVENLPCLVLSVLRPGEDVPHIGKLSELVAAPAPNQSPLMVVRPQHARSYNTPKDIVLMSLTVDALQTDCGKVARYARALPAKLDFLYIECERLRQTAQTYSCPSLMEGVTRLLQQELVSIEAQSGPDSENAQTLHEFIAVLISSPLEVPLKASRAGAVARKNSSASAVAPAASMSINSLLS